MTTVLNTSHQIDIEDVEYLRHGDQPLMARLYRPRGAGPFPLIIQLHGGAWCLYDRLMDHDINEPLAKTGVIVAALDFRMPPAAAYPGSLADINYAIRWFKQRAAQWGGRADRVGIMGSSSGGHQAILSGMRPRDPRYAALPLPGQHAGVDAGVRCVVLCSPVIDPLGRYHYARKLKAGPPPYPHSLDLWLTSHDKYWKTEAAMAEGSPARILERGEKTELPPVLYLQGTHDVAHPRPDLDRFVDVYRKVGGRVELEIYEGEAEGFLVRNAKSDAAAHARGRIAEFVRTELG